ncbi:MAG: crossover junction endodeoxyribonuclease RuvC [Chloroflexota bacterium]
MLAIGIDPGTATSGYGLVRQNPDGELHPVDYGVITTSASAPMPERLAELFRALSDLLASHQPDSGAVEKLYFQRNVSTAMMVGQARGVVLLALAQAGIPVHEYTPREVKQAITGYGGADKRQMQEMVRLLLHLETPPRPDDAADALAIAICHLHAGQLQQRLKEAG